MLRFTVRDIEIGMLTEVPFLYKGNGMMYNNTFGELILSKPSFYQ